MAMRVKVSVSSLLVSAEQALDDAVTSFEKARNEYRAEQDRLRPKRVKAIRRLAQEIEDGRNNLDVSYNGSVTIPSWPKTTKIKPHDGWINRIKRDIALLKASSDETMTIATDSDFAKYLR